MNNSINNKNNIYLFFFAKKVKRDSLFESRTTLLKQKIKLIKSTVDIEKNIRKVRLLDSLIKSSVLVGIPLNQNIGPSEIKKILLNQIPGIEFLGVLVNNTFLPKNRVNLLDGGLAKNEALFQDLAINAITKPMAVVSGKTTNILSLVSHFIKK